jgi:lipopolysaccharide cholinephosphotransferase
MSSFSARDIMTEVSKASDLLIEISGDKKIRFRSVLLEIMSEIHNVCLKNGIQYALVGGSALGAVRHHGFIPWDDDLDISMMREDFEKFKSVFEKELGDTYILDAPNYNNRESKCNFGKVYKKGTELWEVQDAAPDFPFPRGIYVDIFIYENVSRYRIVQVFDSVISNIMKGVGTSMVYYQYDNSILDNFYGTTAKSKFYFKLRKSIGILHLLISHKRWVNFFDKFVSRHKQPSDFITAPTGRKYYLGEFIRRDWWSPMRLADFEGHRFFVPNNVEGYLENLYGPSYMELPPVDKRERHFCVKLDFGDTDKT